MHAGSSYMVVSAARYLQSLGHDPLAIARAVDIPALALRSPTEPLEGKQIEAFFDRAAALSADPHFGLSVARHRVAGNFGLLEFLVRSSTTSGELWQRGSRYFTLLNPSATVRMIVENGQVELTHAIAGAPRGYGRHANESIIVGMVDLARELTGTAWKPTAVWFAHPESDERALADFFGAPITLGRESNGFRFPEGDLALPLLTANPPLAQFLEAQAQEKVKSIPAADDIVAQVEEAIRRELPDGAPNIERLATRLQMSARTLQRRLDERGTKFAELLESIRQQLAHRYVAERDRPVSEIAFLLGYSDVTAFLRAFKRWTGKTPSEVRQND